MAHAERVTTAAEEQVEATRPLMRFVEEFSAHEVDAAIKLVDELPRLTSHITDDVLPILATLDRVGPDIHELLDVANDVRQAILGIPGFDYLRRRGEDKDDDRDKETDKDDRRGLHGRRGLSAVEHRHGARRHGERAGAAVVGGRRAPPGPLRRPAPGAAGSARRRARAPAGVVASAEALNTTTTPSHRGSRSGPARSSRCMTITPGVWSGPPRREAHPLLHQVGRAEPEQR